VSRLLLDDHVEAQPAQLVGQHLRHHPLAIGGRAVLDRRPALNALAHFRL
jgi:hypothetical protein